MSIFKTRLRPLDKKTGTIQNKLDGLKITITPLSDMANVTITPKRVFKASVLGGLFSFVSEVKPFHLLYRWGEYFGNIRTALRAEGVAAPAEEAEVDSHLSVALKAEASVNEVAEAEVDSRPGLAILARAVSYVIAKAILIVQMFMGHHAEATTGKGAVAESVKEIPLHVKREAISADSVEGEPENNPCLTGLSVSGGSAPTQEAFIGTSFIVEGSAVAGTGDSLSLVASVGVGVSHIAKAMVWGYQVINGVLYIPYSYQATQTDDLLYLGVIPETWDSPYLDGSGALVIGQARLTKQEENILGVI